MLEETLKTTFHHQFRTGNVVMDTAINGLIILVMGTLTASVGSVWQGLSWHRIKYGVLQLLGYRRQSLNLRGMITRTGQKNWESFTHRFKAVLFQIKKLQLAESKINRMRELRIGTNETDLFVEQALYFQFCPEVRGYIMSAEVNKNSQNSTYTEETFNIEIFSWTKSLEDIIKLLDSWEKEYTRSFTKQTVKLIGTIKEDFSMEKHQFSDRFFAVLHRISCLDHTGVPDLVELQIVEPGRANPYDRDSKETPEHKRKKISRILPKKFQIDERLSGEIEWDRQKEGFAFLTTYNISINSYVLSSQQISDIIADWETEYESYKFHLQGLRFFAFNPKPDTEASSSSYPNQNSVEEFNDFPFKSNKRFENLFFPEKDAILARLQFFLNNEEWYTERGVPYNLGFMFHGTPGSGKTSTIKAMANLTQRHIVSIPLKHVKTVEDLYRVFYSVSINKREVPIEKRIYVLEDIDAAGLEETVKRRAGAEPELVSPPTLLVEQSGSEKPVEVALATGNKEKKATLTLSDLLEVFDGVMEMKGRILVITTNHPEKLDSALIRPGRIDVNVKFTHIKPCHVIDIFKNFYGAAALPVGFREADLPDNTWTAAEAIQVFLNNMASPATALDILASGKLQEFVLQETASPSPNTNRS